MAEPDQKPFDNSLGITHYTWDEAKSSLFNHLENFKPVHVITLTPEMCVRAHEDGEFRKIIDRAGIVIADGIGVVWGEGKLTGRKPEKIPGIEFASTALKYLDEMKGKCFLIGARPEVVSAAAENLKKEYPSLVVAGCQDGYYKPASENEIVKKIASTKPHLVLVGMGSPKQEEFISKHLEDLNCAAAIGVGGSFDVWSGNVERAPEGVQKAGMEWLYRTLKQPGSRAGRLMKLMRFTSLVLSGKIVQ